MSNSLNRSDKTVEKQKGMKGTIRYFFLYVSLTAGTTNSDSH